MSKQFNRLNFLSEKRKALSVKKTIRYTLYAIRLKQEGFTLIELLIVIAIIGVLASILTVNFIGVRQRGRDAQRKSNIRQIQAALELYRSDTSSYYVSNSLPCANPFASGGITYMQTVPCDPLGGSYQYQGNATTYTLVACLENTSDSDGTSTQPGGFNACSSGRYFVVTNP